MNLTTVEIFFRLFIGSGFTESRSEPRRLAQSGFRILSRSGSRPKFLMTEKKFTQNLQKCILKPFKGHSVSRRSLQPTRLYDSPNMKIIHFPFFSGTNLACLDPDPENSFCWLLYFWNVSFLADTVPVTCSSLDTKCHLSLGGSSSDVTARSPSADADAYASTVCWWFWNGERWRRRTEPAQKDADRVATVLWQSLSEREGLVRRDSITPR